MPSHPNDITIRPAKITDVDAITAFHVRIWRETYSKMVPLEITEILNEKHRLPIWAEALQNPEENKGTFVALYNGIIIGLVSFGPPTHPAFGTRGEIKHLYVDKAYKGMGLGTQLMSIAFDGLIASGFTSIALAVFHLNASALGFYRARGGDVLCRFEDSGPIWKSENLLISWETPGEYYA